MAFKLKGSPMARNYGHPFKQSEPTASDTLTAIQMRELARTEGENTDNTFESMPGYSNAKKILSDTDKKTGDTTVEKGYDNDKATERLLATEYNAARDKETNAKKAAAAKTEQERKVRGSKARNR